MLKINFVIPTPLSTVSSTDQSCGGMGVPHHTAWSELKPANSQSRNSLFWAFQPVEYYKIPCSAVRCEGATVFDVNDLKLVREQARPISADTGLTDIRTLAEHGERRISESSGERRTVDIFDAYIEHMLGYVDTTKLKSLKFVMNAGNGCAGIATDGLEPFLPFELVRIHHEPDGTFPNGISNPLLPENRAAIADAVILHKAGGEAIQSKSGQTFQGGENARVRRRLWG